MKTAFSALFPNAILVAAEKGYMAQVINKIDVNNWKDFVAFINNLHKHRAEIGDNVQTIIIDTVDELYPMASEYVCLKQGIKDKTKYDEIKDIPYGQGWQYHDNEFKKQIKRILSMGFTILYLTHSTIKTIKPKDGEPYDVYKSTMSDRCANIVNAACDYIIHGERRNIEVAEGEWEMKRVLTVRGSDTAVAGNRVYFDEDIIFDTEEEAMSLFQDKFKAGIARNLKKAGITTPIDQLEEQQRQERIEKVQQYMERTKGQVIEEDDIEELPSVDVLHDDIKGVVEKLKKADKEDDLKKVLKETLGMLNYTKSKDAKKLHSTLLKLRELLGEEQGETQSEE